MHRIIVLIIITAFTSLARPLLAQDPREILIKADSALQSIESVSYQMETYRIGTLRMRGLDFNRPPNSGHVTLARIQKEDWFGAKLAVKGGMTSARAYDVTYDGNKIFSLDHEEKIAYVNDPDSIGQRLLISEAEEIILPEFMESDPLQVELSADTLRYDGVARINGVDCYIVNIRYTIEAMHYERWWFFGRDDYLPRQVWIKFSGEQPSGQLQLPGIRVKTISDLKTNIDIDPSVFTPTTPEDYEVRVYEPETRKAETEIPILSVGDSAPNWELKDPQGNSHSLLDLRGNVVLIDFWATWCGPCVAGMPDIQELHEKFRNRNVKVIGINAWESLDSEKYMRDHNYTYQLLLDGDEVAEAYMANVLPTLYVIGTDGKIVHWEVGYDPGSYDDLSQIIENALNQ